MWYRLHVRCDVRDRGGVSLPRYWTKTKIFFPFFYQPFPIAERCVDP